MDVKAWIPSFKFCLLFFLFILAFIIFTPRSWFRYAYNKTMGRFAPHTIDSRLAAIEKSVMLRLKPCLKNGLPDELLLLAYKKEKRLELWGHQASSAWWKIKDYEIVAASGTAGPKLMEGDRQVPEGIYGIENLHPNSNFYLSLKIAYPSAEDIAIAKQEGRDTETLGSFIMLHGYGGSIGCIAVENEAIEEIFTLVARVGVKNVKILIFPHDLSRQKIPSDLKPKWLADRYEKLDSIQKKLSHEKL